LARATPFHIWRPDLLAQLRDPVAANRRAPFRPDLLSRYDCLLIVNEQDFPLAPPPGETLFQGAGFRLLSLKPTRATLSSEAPAASAVASQEKMR
jgi:hypothetical protein